MADQRWIPVEVRLPDDDLTVVVAITNSDEPVWLGFHDGSGWYSVDAMPIKVTHWMPMPEGPNG
jgi:hypothetical protein